MSKVWRYTINIPPMGTPRPRHRFLENGQKITYYDQSYVDYMDAVQAQLERDNALDDTFFEVVNTPLGVKAEIVFYCQAPKSQKRLKKLTRTTAPDIDNLLKAALDSLFKGLDIKDSRIAMVSMGKFQEMENPRTEIVFRGIE
ncbi:RusA family crossover junction endodeoxyribonuclease [Mammaliicoccus lentus]|uniref:RusA family crossover junction endodeoxyribonuclease n=1 Tax=Mammaliicoccus lentus TaxID=42858 RepID=UPI0010720BCB|nr:RusA family crossover junction endodeoxyribonuclease [Mammaliicoccus lentus]MBF0795176.1 RusA family crossover junction endodeoxyribonuclease [Mammaliicoccus lentus]MBF0795270.1 RusA family crossover junction endodeoxyribonuclease [Mammaliicoccus lentus]TFV14578.1 RusA family crossover junction endodeoxyribonuclease [Mammaliicoccus lentus]TFV14666.1 RusA family crossover junction endodeoxyribonuclease [Mammaliicoccus lentus]